MFGTHCDTVYCRNRPVARVRRRFYVRGAEMTTDKELCAAPGCLEHATDLMYEPETRDGVIETLEEKNAEV